VSRSQTVLLLSLLSLVSLLAATAGAQDTPRIARYVPPAPDRAHVFVLDSAHILSSRTVAALQDSALALQAETHGDIAWVTLPTLGGRAIEEAALYIGRSWRVGPAGQPGDPLRNRGLVVLYVPDKTKTAGSNFRIEVGNGLEGTITDSRSRSITNAMREDLRAKRYDAAYMKGWAVAAALVREDYASHGVASAPAARAPVAQPKKHSNAVAATFFLLFVVVLLVVIITTRLKRARRSSGMAFRSRRDETPDETRERHLNRAGLLAMLLQSMNSNNSSSSSSSGDFGGGGSSDSGSSSSGGDFGGGGGFSGGGSSDSI
jgi:uncharacterized protein